MATNFGTQFAITGFVGYNSGCMIASNMLFDSGGWVFGVKLFDEDIADFKVLTDVVMATIFGLSVYGVYIGATSQIRLNRPIVHVWRWCGLMSNYFNHLLWPPWNRTGPLYFCLVVSSIYLSSLFHHLISAVADCIYWIYTSTHGGVALVRI